MPLHINNLRIEYQKGQPTLDRFDLTVNQGELVSLLGPSGCGKTTTLRAVAGFIEPVNGTITIAGQDNTRLPPNKRDIGLVFQNYALFPHLTAFQNVAFGLKMRRVRGRELTRRAEEALALVDLAGFEGRYPSQLSGGQRQRVALARAVVIEPKLLLFDEPLSNLDAKLRLSMRAEIRRLQQRLGITTLYVTHDQAEALAISDRVIVMNQGAIEQSGPPEQIFRQPATPFVADFMGFENHFQATVTRLNESDMTVQAGAATFKIPLTQSLNLGDSCWLYFRASGAQLAAVSASPLLENHLPGAITLRTFQGDIIEYRVETELGPFTLHHDDLAPQFELGPIQMVLNPQKVVVLYSSQTFKVSKTLKV